MIHNFTGIESSLHNMKCLKLRFSVWGFHFPSQTLPTMGGSISSSPTRTTRARSTSGEKRRSYNSKNELRCGTIRMIFHVETAQQAFLAFLHQQILQKNHCPQGRHCHLKNFIQEMLFVELFSHLRTNGIINFDDFGRNSSSFHNYATVADQIRDDPSLSLAFLNQLEGLEQYLMVVATSRDAVSRSSSSHVPSCVWRDK
jgi:hypothetical protein